MTDYHSEARERLMEVKTQLCSQYFPEIAPEAIALNIKITDSNSGDRVYAFVDDNPSGQGYKVSVGLPTEVVLNETLLREIFTGVFAHELGHIARGHPRSFVSGLANILEMLGDTCRPLKRIGKVGRNINRNMEDEANHEAVQRGLEKELEQMYAHVERLNEQN